MASRFPIGVATIDKTPFLLDITDEYSTFLIGSQQEDLMANNQDEIDDPFEIPVGPTPYIMEKRCMRDSLMEIAKYELQDVGNWIIESIRSGVYVVGRDENRFPTAHNGKRYQVVVTVRCIPVEEIEK